MFFEGAREDDYKKQIPIPRADIALVAENPCFIGCEHPFFPQQAKAG